jgi:hypothetical protein
LLSRVIHLELSYLLRPRNSIVVNNSQALAVLSHRFKRPDHFPTDRRRSVIFVGFHLNR